MPWINTDGYDVLRQEHEQSCGYCCIGMAVNLIEGGRRDSESAIVATGRRVGGVRAYDRHAKDRVGAMKTALVDAAEEEFGQVPHWGSGTYGNHLADVLTKEYRVNAKYFNNIGSGSRKDAMRHVSGNQYMIALVRWNAGGGHWVLVVNRKTRGWGAASDYTILDPAGHVVINRGSTDYRPPYGAGVCAGYYVVIQGRLALPNQGRGPRVIF